MAVGRSVVGPECFLAPLRVRPPNPPHICVVALDRRRRLNKSIGAAAGEAVSAKRATVSLNLNKRSKKFMVTKIWLYWMLRTISSSFDTFWVNPITSKEFYKVQIFSTGFEIGAGKMAVMVGS